MRLGDYGDGVDRAHFYAGKAGDARPGVGQGPLGAGAQGGCRAGGDAHAATGAAKVDGDADRHDRAPTG
jgi:hypothetical protein